MRREGSGALLIILIVVALLVVGGVWYSYESKQSSASSNNTANTSTSTAPSVVSQNATTSNSASVISSSTIALPDGNDQYSNSTYGIAVTYPAADVESVGANNDFFTSRGSNFDASTSVTTLTRVEVSGDFPTSNYGGALFSAFVNPGIPNSSTCLKFGTVVLGEPVSSQVIKGTTYSETKDEFGSATFWVDFYEFHTFKNSLCYELDLQTDIAANAYDDIESTTTPPAQIDSNVVNLFLGGTTFFQPTP